MRPSRQRRGLGSAIATTTSHAVHRVLEVLHIRSSAYSAASAEVVSRDSTSSLCCLQVSEQQPPPLPNQPSLAQPTERARLSELVRRVSRKQRLRPTASHIEIRPESQGVLLRSASAENLLNVAPTLAPTRRRLTPKLTVQIDTSFRLSDIMCIEDTLAPPSEESLLPSPAETLPPATPYETDFPSPIIGSSRLSEQRVHFAPLPSPQHDSDKPPVDQHSTSTLRRGSSCSSLALPTRRDSPLPVLNASELSLGSLDLRLRPQSTPPRSNLQRRGSVQSQNGARVDRPVLKAWMSGPQAYRRPRRPSTHPPTLSAATPAPGPSTLPAKRKASNEPKLFMRPRSHTLPPRRARVRTPPQKPKPAGPLPMPPRAASLDLGSPTRTSTPPRTAPTQLVVLPPCFESNGLGFRDPDSPILGPTLRCDADLDWDFDASTIGGTPSLLSASPWSNPSDESFEIGSAEDVDLSCDDDASMGPCIVIAATNDDDDDDGSGGGDTTMRASYIAAKTHDGLLRPPAPMWLYRNRRTSISSMASVDATEMREHLDGIAESFAF